MPSNDGMNYAPTGRAKPVVEPGEFVFAAVGLDHGHIYGMCNGLREAGGQLGAVYDPDPAKVAAFVERYPDTPVAGSEQALLDDERIRLVAGASVPADRAGLGLRVLAAGKHYFTDKPPLTSLAQLAEARKAVEASGHKYAVYFSERLHSEAGTYAGQLVADGAIGRVVQVMGTGPHRINAPSRPDWFWDRERFGGILCDIGSHQVEQILFYGGSDNAEIVSSRVANFGHKEHPGFDDFGDMTVSLDNGTVGYSRVDWFTPDGLGTWGDGRTVLLGTKGYIELRKYIDVGREATGDHVYLVDNEGEHHIPVSGTVGYPFFGQLILDCLDGGERAMTQSHAFAAAELCVVAQQNAMRVEG